MKSTMQPLMSMSKCLTPMSVINKKPCMKAKNKFEPMIGIKRLREDKDAVMLTHSLKMRMENWEVPQETSRSRGVIAMTESRVLQSELTSMSQSSHGSL